VNLYIDKLTATPQALVFEASVAWWREHQSRALEIEYEVTSDFCFEIKSHTMGTDVYLAGNLSGEIEVECSRCISRYSQALRDQFQLVLEPARDRTPADPEGAEALARDGLWLGDELESGWYRGTRLRLDPYFAEVVSLTIPVQPVCREDCAGLCPRCGENRNTAGCGCEVASSSSPFAALAALRSQGSGGDL
jgi:uncharacterized protein